MNRSEFYSWKPFDPDSICLSEYYLKLKAVLDFERHPKYGYVNYGYNEIKDLLILTVEMKKLEFIINRHKYDERPYDYQYKNETVNIHQAGVLLDELNNKFIESMNSDIQAKSLIIHDLYQPIIQRKQHENIETLMKRKYNEGVNQGVLICMAMVIKSLRENVDDEMWKSIISNTDFSDEEKEKMLELFNV